MRLTYDRDGSLLVWLVWKMASGKPVLAVICTNTTIMERYVTRNHKATIGTGEPVFCEQVATNHLYGANDSRIAMRILANTRD